MPTWAVSPHDDGIVLAGDSSVYRGIELLPEPDGRIRTYVGIGHEQIEFLQYLVRFMSPNAELIAHDCKQVYEDHLKDAINWDTGFSPYAAFRLCLDMVLPQEIYHCLYLDADVIVQDRLGLMYQYYIDKEDFDYAAYTLPQACDGFGELISGVVFFNLGHIRWSGFLNRARMNYRRKQYPYPDQGALADAGTAPPMLETFNYMEGIKDAHYKPAIVHFTNREHSKIYSGTPGDFYRYYPEYLYLKDGIDLIRECYERDR